MIFAKRIDHANDDLSVVNAARVSMDKQVTEFAMQGGCIHQERQLDGSMGSDEALVGYLAKNNHWTPFAHQRFRFAMPTPSEFDFELWLKYLGDEQRRAGFQIEWDEERQWWELEHSLFGWLTSPPPRMPMKILGFLHKQAPVSFRALYGYWGGTADQQEYATMLPAKAQTFLVECPIYVARQLMRSNVGIVYNEVSRRYVDSDPEFHRIEKWRGKADNVKQGSGTYLPLEHQASCLYWSDSGHSRVRLSYSSILLAGAAPEQARSVLPVSTMTKIWMTATDSALARVIGLREDKHAQKEIRDLADCLRAERIER